jgi:hypothetical protein
MKKKSVIFIGVGGEAYEGRMAAERAFDLRRAPR